MSKKGGVVINAYGSHRTAILATYPHVKLQLNNFSMLRTMLSQITTLDAEKWKDNFVNQKRFFDRLAKDKGFHPTKEPNRWYSIRKRDVTAYKVCDLKWEEW